MGGGKPKDPGRGKPKDLQATFDVGDVTRRSLSPSRRPFHFTFYRNGCRGRRLVVVVVLVDSTLSTSFPFLDATRRVVVVVLVVVVLVVVAVTKTRDYPPVTVRKLGR